MLKEELKAYFKAYRQAHKEQLKANKKAWKELHKEQVKANKKAWYEANRQSVKAYQKAHKDEYKAYQKAYKKSEVNSLGQTKNYIRLKSRNILKKSGIKIPGYENHHCFGYEDPSKFIYCSKEIHLKIHQYLRDNNIDADSDHYEQIKHLLDEKVFLFK